MRYLALTICVLSLLTTTPTVAAPVPPVKVKTRPPLIGEWQMTWGPGGGRCLFRSDKSYRYTWGATDYSGHWELKGNTLILHDRNHEADWEVPFKPYVIHLQPGVWVGKSSDWGDHAWKLEKAGAK